MIKLSDTRVNSTRIIEAKQAEIPELINREKFRAVLRNELPDSSNTTNARHDLGIKPSSENIIIHKDRYLSCLTSGDHAKILSPRSKTHSMYMSTSDLCFSQR